MKMKIGRLSILTTTLIFILAPIMVLEIPKVDRCSKGYLGVVLFCVLFYLYLLIGFGQIFHFKKDELLVRFLNPFKKDISIPYASISRVEVFRYVPSFAINVFCFKINGNSVDINNNIFTVLELKKIKKIFAKKNIECEL